MGGKKAFALHSVSQLTKCIPILGPEKFANARVLKLQDNFWFTNTFHNYVPLFVDFRA